MSMVQPDLLGVRRPSASALLATLAIIQVDWDHHNRSYLDHFVPFVLEVMRGDPARSWTETEVQTGLADRFGLAIPARVVGSLLNRAASKKHAIRSSRTYTLAQAQVAVNAGKKSLAATQRACLREQRHLAVELAKMASELFDLGWSEDDAENALAAYIEEHAVPILSASTRGSSLATPSGPPGTEYIVSTFIYTVARNNPQLFEYLDRMVKGSMLAAALYMAVPAIDRRFHNTTLYVDTPVCLMALGLDGEEAEQAVSQVISMAKAQGAVIACFEHSVTEMIGILSAAIGSLRRGHSRGSDFAVAERFRANGTTPSDVERLISQLREKIEDLGIAVRQTPDPLAHLTVDEDALQDLLQARVGYRNVDALLRDLDSLTAIHRLRGGAATGELERCKALLVTSNTKLVQVAREFFDRTKHEWPLAMTDNDIAALLWAKQPHHYPDLPRTQVIADCIAALSPSPGLWESVLQETERLQTQGIITAQDVAIMRYAPEARRAVMDATLGVPKNVSAKNVQRALRQATDKVSEPVRQELKAALERESAAEGSRAELTFHAETLRHQLEEKTRQEQSRADAAAQLHRRIREGAVATARRWRIGLIVVGVVVVVSCGFGYFMSGTGIAQWLLGLGGLLGIFSTVFGSVADRIGPLEPKLATWLEHRRLAKLGLVPLPASAPDDRDMGTL
jgi:hypothetical protein